MLAIVAFSYEARPMPDFADCLAALSRRVLHAAKLGIGCRQCLTASRLSGSAENRRKSAKNRQFLGGSRDLPDALLFESANVEYKPIPEPIPVHSRA